MFHIVHIVQRIEHRFTQSGFRYALSLSPPLCGLHLTTAAPRQHQQPRIRNSTAFSHSRTCGMTLFCVGSISHAVHKSPLAASRLLLLQESFIFVYSGGCSIIIIIIGHHIHSQRNLNSHHVQNISQYKKTFEREQRTRRFRNFHVYKQRYPAMVRAGVAPASCV